MIAFSNPDQRPNNQSCGNPGQKVKMIGMLCIQTCSGFHSDVNNWALLTPRNSTTQFWVEQGKPENGQKLFRVCVSLILNSFKTGYSITHISAHNVQIGLRHSFFLQFFKATLVPKTLVAAALLPQVSAVKRLRRGAAILWKVSFVSSFCLSTADCQKNDSLTD